MQLSAPDERDDEALGVLLLRDIRDVYAAAGVDRLSSAELASRLGELEESPWGDLWGKQLDARGLARRLRPFQVRPRTVRLDDGTTPKGYHLEQFEEAFSRYAPVPADSERHNATTRTVEPKTGYFQPPREQACGGSENGANPHGSGDVALWRLESAETAPEQDAEADADPFAPEQTELEWH